MIPDEAVRGRTPPPWFFALSGFERIRAFAQGKLPHPPVARLLGIRTTHVVPGSATCTMPVSEALLGANGELEIVPIMMSALAAACATALPAGAETAPLLFSINPFRPARLQTGNLLARAQILNSSSLFVIAEVQLEDPEGRHLAHGIHQMAIRRVQPPPPPPPDPLPAVEEPVYDTPDPYLRRYRDKLPSELFEQHDGLSIIRGIVGDGPEGDSKIPMDDLFGLRWEQIKERHVVVSMPASEWFAGWSGYVSAGIIAAFADIAGRCGAMTLHRPGTSMVGLNGVVRYLRSVATDGRRLVAETTLTEHTPESFIADTTIRDASGDLIAIQSAAGARIDDSQRSARRSKDARRILGTLLFTDIVESTVHAERLGDARWRSLLEKHHAVIRREVSRYDGTEVDTAGDGFFVRFDSPARAIDAARAARAATAALGVEIRAGIHTGECELEGNRPVGMAVHLAARIQAAAQAGEILVSSTVKDLAMGANLRFEDRGEHTLKGVPDPWRLYAVLD